MEKKIQKFKLSSVFEAVVNEAADGKIVAVSIGAGIQIKKDSAGSALFIESASGPAARYNKVEDKELELPVLQNELAGLVGSFDGSVHKLMSKYGFEWVNPAAKPAAEPANESAIYEAGGADPVGTWVGDFFVTSAISLSKMVDAAVENYGFDDQKVENAFRTKVVELLKENDDSLTEQLVGSDTAESNLVEEMRIFLDFHEDELSEFADYK